MKGGLQLNFRYASLDEAIACTGWRMVVVGGIPSPWGEAAKGILHVKAIPWTAVRLDYESEALVRWAGRRSAPVVVYDEERPRSGWAEILLLAERVAPSPSLLPADLGERALALGMAHQICAEEGLGWWRRLQLVQAAFDGQGGFTEPVAKYIGRKYGYTPSAGSVARERVVALLGFLSARLKAQAAAGSDYFIGHGLTAVDIYSATFMGFFRPFPEELCAMDRATRAAFETLDEETARALDPVLLQHRDRIYREHLVLPLSL